MAFKVVNDELKEQLWKAADLLKGNLAADEHDVFLFLISMQREGLLSNLGDYDPFERRFKLDDFIEGDLLAHNELFEELYDNVYKEIIQNIPVDAFARLIDLILGIDLAHSFSDLFDSFLSNFIKSSGKGRSFNTPNQIAEFAFSLVDLPNGANIYNPFAGLSSFGVLTKGDQKYFGQEVDRKTWGIGLLRLYAYDILPNGSFINESSIQNWYPSFEGDFSFLEKLLKTGAQRRKDVDLIISSPQFSYRSPDVEHLFGKKYTMETFVLEQGLEILSDKGKIVCLISNGRLFAGGHERDLRQRLIQDDHLEMVISFPGSLLLNTSIPFTVLVVNKAKTLKDVVKFVDVSSFITREKRDWTFDYKDLLDDIHANIENDAIRILPNKRIEEEDFNLSVNRYFIKEINGVVIANLGEIFETRTTVDKVGHLITGQWLKADPLNFLIPNNFVPFETLPKSCRQITESCFLVLATGGKLKIGFFKYEGIPFYISPEIFPFRLVSQSLTPEYFVYQLLSQSTIDQLRAYTFGSAIQRISKSDFMRMKLDIPSTQNMQESLQHQASVLKGARNAYINIREKELENERQLLGLKEEATRNFQSMKRTFRQYLSSLKSNTLGTKKFLQLNEGKQISLNMLYSKNLGQDLGTHLRNVDLLITSLSNLLDDSPEKGSAEVIDVVEFVTLFQNEFTFDNRFSYMLIIDDVSFYDEEGPDLQPLISIDKLQFKKVLSNIVSNAVEHGFIGKKKYIVSFIVMIEDKTVVLDISNNGEPMPEGFGLKELTTRGEKMVSSKGTGLGGYDIKTIIEMYNGRFEFESNPKDDFSVRYRIRFPLISE